MCIIPWEAHQKDIPLSHKMEPMINNWYFVILNKDIRLTNLVVETVWMDVNIVKTLVNVKLVFKDLIKYQIQNVLVILQLNYRNSLMIINKSKLLLIETFI